MSRKIILIKQELLLLVYELNRSGLLAENEKIRPILAQLEKLLLCDLSPSTNDSEIGRAVQQECRDRSRIPFSASHKQHARRYPVPPQHNRHLLTSLTTTITLTFPLFF